MKCAPPISEASARAHHPESKVLCGEVTEVSSHKIATVCCDRLLLAHSATPNFIIITFACHEIFCHFRQAVLRPLARCARGNCLPSDPLVTPLLLVSRVLTKDVGSRTQTIATCRDNKWLK